MDIVRDLICQAISLKGSQAKLAEAAGVKQQSIWQAKEAGRVSAELALAIHRATSGAVPASALRPDLWRRPEDVPTSEPAEAAE